MVIEDRENTLIIKLETGWVVVDLFEEVAPLHAERIKTLARAEEYDNVAFHRVLDGFVAQTGDVEFGDLEDGYDPQRAGQGESDLPDLVAELSDIPFERGVVGMARGPSLNSANSQFFIMFEEADFLNGNYTVVGQVLGGMELVDQIKRGDPARNGAVTDPDRMIEVDVYADYFGQGLTAAEAQEVALLYEAVLNRDGAIDLPGLNYWIDVREGAVPGQVRPLSIEEVSQYFLDSTEFAAAFGDPGALSNRALVERLYFNVLDRQGEPEGIAFWTGAAYTPGFSRAELLHAFAVSVENAQTLEFVETLAEVAPGDWAFA